VVFYHPDTAAVHQAGNVALGINHVVEGIGGRIGGQGRQLVFRVGIAYVQRTATAETADRCGHTGQPEQTVIAVGRSTPMQFHQECNKS